MKVFISWSKRKSMEFAIRTKALIERIDPQSDVFVSEIDVTGGEYVQEQIIRKITECDKLVLCFTKENKRAPWLLFEAGYASALKKHVIPLLFDHDPLWHSWIDNPMNIVREIRFQSQDFPTAFLSSLGIKATSKYRKFSQEYVQSIIEIKEQFREVDVHCEDLVAKLAHNEAFVKENPLYKDKAAYFLTGFESYDLLRAITDSFMYTGKYLWIYGRKNMKLFGGSFKEFFEYLKLKASDQTMKMGGIDFRCLFLDPNSNETERAHPQQDIFKPELTATIYRAKDVIGDNAQLRSCFRFYSHKRDEIIIRLDNSIIYSRPHFDALGRPQLLTNTGFEVFSTKSDRGSECVEKYEKIWTNAKEMY